MAALSDGLAAEAVDARGSHDGASASMPLTSVQLGHDIKSAQTDLERSAQLAGLKNDPIAPLIRALSASLGLQWRLHDQAVGYFRSVSARLDRQLEDTIRQGELALATRRTAIVEELAPAVAALTTKNALVWGRTITAKAALTFGGFAVALALGVGAAAYGAGWKAGQDSGLTMSRTLSAAIAQSQPGSEQALAGMIQANNLIEAWEKCQKTALADKEGRRVCLMPMWAEPQKQPGR